MDGMVGLRSFIERLGKGKGTWCSRVHVALSVGVFGHEARSRLPAHLQRVTFLMDTLGRELRMVNLPRMSAEERRKCEGWEDLIGAEVSKQ